MKFRSMSATIRLAIDCDPVRRGCQLDFHSLVPWATVAAEWNSGYFRLESGLILAIVVGFRTVTLLTSASSIANRPAAIRPATSCGSIGHGVRPDRNQFSIGVSRIYTHERRDRRCWRVEFRPFSTENLPRSSWTPRPIGPRSDFS